MTLGQKQERFSEMVVSLMTYVLSKGYGIRMKHVLRCEDCPIGHKNSCHKHGLAIDLVFTTMQGILTRTEDYTFAGEYWESLGGSWGGRFKDGGHFSLEHNGVR